MMLGTDRYSSDTWRLCAPLFKYLFKKITNITLILISQGQGDVALCRHMQRASRARKRFGTENVTTDVCTNII